MRGENGRRKCPHVGAYGKERGERCLVDPTPGTNGRDECPNMGSLGGSAKRSVGSVKWWLLLGGKLAGLRWKGDKMWFGPWDGGNQCWASPTRLPPPKTQLLPWKHGAAPSPWTPPSLPKETCSWSATLRASRESLLRRGAVLRAIAQGRVWGWIIEDETTPTNSPPPILLNGDMQAPQRRRCRNQTRPIVVGDVVTSPLLGSPTPSGLFLTCVG